MFSGLRFRLLLLVLMTCAPLVALTLHTSWEDRRRQVLNWQQRAARVAQLATQEESEFIVDTRQHLLGISELQAFRNFRRPNAENYLNQYLRTYPKYSNFGLIRTNGDLLAYCRPPQEDLAQLPFFRQVLESGSFSVGQQARSPSLTKPLAHFGHPVRDKTGTILSVVFASCDLQAVIGDGSQVPANLPRGATWAEIDTNGVILAHLPKPDAWVGRIHPEKAVVDAAFGRAADARTGSAPRAPDGTTGESVAGVLRTRGTNNRQIVHAFTPIQTRFAVGPTVGILSIPSRVLFAQANRQLARNLTWLGAAAALAFFLGWVGSNFLIVRPVRALVRSTTRLAGGDLRSRTGLRHGRDELGQLTLSFDRMAQALEDRERDRERANHRLQVLSHRLVEVQESERRQIARELHDEIGQSLTAAEMNLQAALQSPREASLQRRLEESIRAVEKVLAQVHDLSLNLRPSMLDDLGLEAALRWYTHQQAELAGLKAEFRPVPLEDRPHAVVETECFRIAQEALNNVVKHANARSVLVELSKANHKLHLTVSDDGVGFDVDLVRDRAVHGDSLGVLSMEERAALAGGGLKIESEPGRGTTVRAWFDLRMRFDLPELELDTIDKSNGND